MFLTDAAKSFKNLHNFLKIPVNVKTAYVLHICDINDNVHP